LSDKNAQRSKIPWLSVLQGFAILLVVVGHAWLTEDVDPNHPVVSETGRIIYHFHMALFFAISGYLFWETKLKREKPWTEIVSDKARRLLVPYLGFTLATLAIKLALPGAVSRQAELSPGYILKSLVYPETNPLGELWFVAALFLMFLPGRLYRILSNGALASLAVLATATAINWMFDFSLALFGGRLAIFYFPSFFFGLCMARFDIPARLVLRWWALPLCAATIGLLEIVGLPNGLHLIVVSFGWIVACFWMALLAARSFPLLFSSFRDWTFQIFLLGIFFQMAVRVVYRKLETGYPALFALSVVLGIYGSVLLAKLYKRFAPKWMHPLLGL